jgi:hypothetical protein
MRSRSKLSPILKAHAMESVEPVDNKAALSHLLLCELLGEQSLQNAGGKTQTLQACGRTIEGCFNDSMGKA